MIDNLPRKSKEKLNKSDFEKLDKNDILSKLRHLLTHETHDT